MIQERLTVLMHSALQEAGFSRAKIDLLSRKLERPVCPKGQDVYVNLFSIAKKDLPPLTTQYVSALDVPGHQPIVSVGDLNEPTIDVAYDTLKMACQTYGCHNNPNACVFRKTVGQLLPPQTENPSLQDA